MGADDLEEEIRSWQAGEERRSICVSQSTGCCFESELEQLFTLGAAHARQQVQALQEFNRRFEVPATEEKNDSKRLKRSRCKEQLVAKWVHQGQAGAMKAFRLVLFLILLGTRMQMVKAVEEEISIRQEMNRIIETVHALPRTQPQQVQFCERERE